MSRADRKKVSTTAKQAHKGFIYGLTSLFTLTPIPRPLTLVALNSFCITLPLMLGMLTEHIAVGLTACLGALLGLYSPSFTPGYRAGAMFKMIAPFCASFTLGLFTQQNLSASSLSLGIVAVVAVYFALYKQMRPPAGFFFIMVCCLSKTHHVATADIPILATAFLGGSLMVTGAVFLHDLIMVRTRLTPQNAPPSSFWQLSALVKALIVGIAVGGSYYLANLWGIDNPYWVPITVAAILQGQRMTDFWQRALHRAIGTALGMVLAAGIFALSPPPLVLIFLLFALAFTIEILITKNYALACIFITPLTIILAHTAPPGDSAGTLIIARMTDVLMGVCFALAAGVLLKVLPVKNR